MLGTVVMDILIAMQAAKAPSTASGQTQDGPSSARREALADPDSEAQASGLDATSPLLPHPVRVAQD